MGMNHLSQLSSANHGKDVQQDRFQCIHGALVVGVPSSENIHNNCVQTSKEIEIPRLIDRVLSGGIVSKISVTNVPWSQIKGFASENATKNSPRLRDVAEFSAARCSADREPSTLHISEGEAQSSLSYAS